MRKWLLWAGVVALAMAGCGSFPDAPEQRELQALGAETYRDLAKYWAPRIYHDTDDSYYLGDYITHFNFDGDYNGKNNWENLDAFATVPAYVYYAVSETETHYFIHYALFHPRDWHEWLSADRHENDLEGVSLVVRKGGRYGSLIAMETLAHDEFYQYGAHASVANGGESLDGTVSLFDQRHPRIFVEAKGHGIYGCDDRCDRAPGGDGIVYFEGGVAESPLGGDGDYTRRVSYALIAFDADGSVDGNEGFWHRRYDICDECTFGAWGKLRGDTFGENKAKTAWAWDDPDDGEVFAGSLLCDPALLFDVHFGGSAFDTGFSHRYVSHPYYTHALDLFSVVSDENRDWLGGASDPYVLVTAQGSPAGSDTVLDAASWLKFEAAAGVWYPYRRGGDQATGRGAYGTDFGSHTFCRPKGSAVSVAVYDRDTTSDELLGQMVLDASSDHTRGASLGAARLKFRFESLEADALVAFE